VCDGLYGSEGYSVGEWCGDRERSVIERVELVSGETCVTVCIAVRGIQRGRMMWRQRGVW
jgi:hypothetical protein